MCLLCHIFLAKQTTTQCENSVNRVHWNACITVKMSWFALQGFSMLYSLCFGFENNILLIFAKYDAATQCLMRMLLNKQLFCQLCAFCILDKMFLKDRLTEIAHAIQCVHNLFIVLRLCVCEYVCYMFDSIEINFSCAMKSYHLNKFNKFYCRIVFSVELPLLLFFMFGINNSRKEEANKQITHTNTHTHIMCW